MTVRQEVVNVLLAQLLEERGLIAAPEQILRAPLSEARLPDVLVDFQGLRLAIEAEFESTPKAHAAAYLKARERVEEGIAHLGAAVVYPEKLRDADFGRLKRDLSKAVLSFCIVSEVDITEAQLKLFDLEQAPEFHKGKLDDFADSLGHSYEQLVEDRTLEQVIARIEAAIEKFLWALNIQPAAVDRMAQAIGASLKPVRGKASAVLLRQRQAASRIGALILINAMIFQEVLSGKDRRVKSLKNLGADWDFVVATNRHWDYILNNINYYPIFHLANEVLSSLTADKDMARAIRALADTATTAVSWRASLRHDLAGRIYHRLLQEAKYLGAYYTAIPSAALLLKLALAPSDSDQSWSDTKRLEEFKIADLACGTGTLLMASADVVIDNYVRACAAHGVRPDLPRMHHLMVEKILHGYDVMASAIHLTASTLSLRVPETPINVTHLYRLPLGGKDKALGTLEFLKRHELAGTLFGQSEHEQVLGLKREHHSPVAIPDLDVCVMNPPFTRSVGGNLLFGNLPDGERHEMQVKLKGLVRERKLSANVTAGLGSVFVALADLHLKRPGTLALVLPRAVLSGVAWEPTRRLINTDYDLAYVIVSHEPGRWNFSENTDLSEALIVARKRAKGGKAREARSVWVNLWRQPRTSIEALSIARSIARQDPPDVQGGPGALQIEIGNRKYGEAVSVHRSEVEPGMWGIPCSFAQIELVRSLWYLRQGKLYLPRQGEVGILKLCALSELGSLGFDRRDMHDGFHPPVRHKTSYPALWNHDARKICSMRQEPNAWLEPLHEAKDGRPLRNAHHLWKKAARVMFAERLWLKTMRLSAVRLDHKALGNVWWPLLLSDGPEVTQGEKALVLWMNSTLGVLTLIGYREETRGAWVGFKKPVLNKMPVLNTAALTPGQRGKLAQVYDKLADQSLKPFGDMGCDDTRMAIDQAVTATLKLPDLAHLRELLAQEPILCLSVDHLLPQRKGNGGKLRKG